MNRRNFVRNSALGVFSLGTMSFEDYVRFLDSPNVAAYEFDINAPDFQETLKSNSLPKTVRIKSRRKTPDKTRWDVGEGIEHSGDYKFGSAVSRHNNRVDDFYHIEGVYTPVTILQTANHDIYGQFFKNAHGNFTYGIIKGFDKKYHIVHPIMRRVFTYKYNCYGLPTSDYEEKRCTKCNERYVRQDFKKSCDSSIVTLYGWMKCSRGGVHSGIPRLDYLAPCGVKDDGINIGASF